MWDRVRRIYREEKREREIDRQKKRDKRERQTERGGKKRDSSLFTH